MVELELFERVNLVMDHLHNNTGLKVGVTVDSDTETVCRCIIHTVTDPTVKQRLTRRLNGLVAKHAEKEGVKA